MNNHGLSLFAQAGISRLVVKIALRSSDPMTTLGLIISQQKKMMARVAHPDIATSLPKDMSTMLFSAYSALKSMEPDQLLEQAQKYASDSSPEEVFGIKYELRHMREELGKKDQLVQRLANQLKTAAVNNKRLLTEQKAAAVQGNAGPLMANQIQDFFDQLLNWINKCSETKLDNKKTAISQASQIADLMGCIFVAKPLLVLVGQTGGKERYRAKVRFGKISQGLLYSADEISLELLVLKDGIRSIYQELHAQLVPTMRTEKLPYSPERTQQIADREKELLSQKELLCQTKQTRQWVKDRLNAEYPGEYLEWNLLGIPICCVDAETADLIEKQEAGKIYSLPEVLQIRSKCEVAFGEGQPILSLRPFGGRYDKRYRLECFPGITFAHPPKYRL